MGVADAFRRNRKERQQEEKREEQQAVKLDAFDILLDGSFPRSVGTQEKVEYIPLTLAEKQELKDDAEKAIIRMMAKAIKYRLDRGLDTPKSAGLDESKSIEENVLLMLNSTPTATREAIFLSIQIDISERIRSLLESFTNLREEYKNTDDLPNRQKNDLDPFVVFMNTYKDSPYTLKEIAEMTELQYQAFSLAKFEANVRQANDHTNMSDRIKAKAGSKDATGKGVSKKRTVGS